MQTIIYHPDLENQLRSIADSSEHSQIAVTIRANDPSDENELHDIRRIEKLIDSGEICGLVFWEDYPSGLFQVESLSELGI
ncbi:hypothetical protein Thi970DRAFT_04648 [Thiorhodovibrio frisius]|uniref:Uncharacterized protein n=1 Tax=Thiorhodovibrio frisius TaxID=631362 RepID=H8Z7V6_9GAMM|nr:hypothetical protein Thi970DRAFT_04648 [Thiorhodovibrio frisius]WPL22025.1 hypothetical protein Thiofri_02174 [Thiorhodovibrio frisius]